MSVRHPKAARRRPARSSSGESEGVTTWRIAASRDDDRAPDQTNALDLAALSHLDPPPESVRDVKERLKWGTDRATKALQVWRSSFLTHRYSNEEHACHAAHRRHAHPGAGGWLFWADQDCGRIRTSLGLIFGGIPRAGSSVDSCKTSCGGCSRPPLAGSVLAISGDMGGAEVA